MTAPRISTDDPVVVRDELPPPVTEDRLRPPSCVRPTLPYEHVEHATTHAYACSVLVRAALPRGLWHRADCVRRRHDGEGRLRSADRRADHRGLEDHADHRDRHRRGVAGVLLILASLSPRGRIFGAFIGALVGVGGIVVLAASNDRAGRPPHRACTGLGPARDRWPLAARRVLPDPCRRLDARRGAP